MKPSRVRLDLSFHAPFRRASLLWVGGVVLLALACGGPSVGDRDSGAPPPLSVRASVDRAEVASGDQVRLTIEVDYDEDYRVEELEVGDEISGLEVLERGRNVLRTVRGRTGLIDWFLLRPPTVGSYVVAPLEVLAVTPDGQEVRESTNEVFVEVSTRLGEGDETEGLRGLKPPVEPPARWPWVLAGLVLVVLLAVWWWWRQRRGPENTETVLAPHELAFAELEALRSTDFTDLVELRRYYFELSAVLRRYIEGRFGLNATDLTSQEIRARLEELGLRSSQETQLESFFVATDGVKYAAQVPSERAVETVYEAALGFVEQTVPTPSTEDPTAEEDSDGGSIDGPAVEDQPVEGTVAVAGEDNSVVENDDPDARFRP